MARQIINTGTLALNGQDGDTNRDASTKINANFAELYAENGNFIRGAGVVVAGAIAVFAGTTGNQLTSRPASDFEPALAVGTAAQYRNGLKALVDFGTSVRAALLTGLSVASSAAVVATDSVLVGVGKLQAQITAASTALAGNVRSTVLTGLSLVTSSAITATDTVLTAMGKLQAQVSAKEPAITAGTVAQYITGAKTLLTFSASVLATAMAGISFATNSAVVAADTLLVAVGKLQAQITTLQGLDIGIGQTWQTLTSSRAINTVYTNDTPRPIQIAGLVSGTSGSNVVPIVTVGTTPIYGAYAQGANNYIPLPSVIVPPGGSYRLTIGNGTATLTFWQELRA